MKGNKLNYKICKISDNDKIPYNLLLLADPSKKIIDDYLDRGMTYAYKTDKIIGIYVLIKTKPHTMELVNIAVNPNYQGQGIGKNLVLDAIKKAKKEGANRLEIGTGNSSLSQLALYQKCGFRIVGIDRDFFIKNYDEEIIENGIRCVDMIRLGMDL